jgi:hypothetical protein
MAKIRILIGDEVFDATLDEQSAPDTVRKILNALPIEATANTWGEEIYFCIPVDTDLENGVETVSVGDLGYWPDGSAFCIFFGKTPLTTSLDEVKPASAVSPIGRIENVETLKRQGLGGETVAQDSGGR